MKYECEFCGEFRCNDKNDTVCGPCDRQMIADQAEFVAKQKDSGRKCTQCSTALPASRYYVCNSCVRPSFMVEDSQVQVDSWWGALEDITEILTRRENLAAGLIKNSFAAPNHWLKPQAQRLTGKRPSKKEVA